jgi:hypothetical protein
MIFIETVKGVREKIKLPRAVTFSCVTTALPLSLRTPFEG